MKRTTAIFMAVLMLFGAVSCAVRGASAKTDPVTAKPETPTDLTASSDTGSQTVGTTENEHVHQPSPGKNYCLTCGEILKKNEKAYKDMIYFSCDDKTLTEAYKIALKDVTGNVKDYKAGALKTSAKWMSILRLFCRRLTEINNANVHAKTKE